MTLMLLHFRMLLDDFVPEGTPSLVNSHNAKTFKAAAKLFVKVPNVVKILVPALCCASHDVHILLYYLLQRTQVSSS